MKVFLPSAITCPPKYHPDGISGTLPAGWVDLDKGYATALIKVGSALSEKDYNAKAKKVEAVETAYAKQTAEHRKEVAKVEKAKQTQAAASIKAAEAAAKAATSKSKYEKSTTKAG